MLASFPASMLNQSRPDSGIPNRINLISPRSSGPMTITTDRATEVMLSVINHSDGQGIYQRTVPGLISIASALTS